MFDSFNRLPVSCTNVDTANMVNSAPGTAPFNVPVDVSPEVQQFAGFALGLFINELQSNAYRNPLRTFTFNFLSRNGWRNDDFIQAYTSLVEYAELLVFGRGLNPQQAIPDAARELSTILTSIYAIKFPELSASLNPVQQQEIQALNNRFKEISENVAKYMQHKQSSTGWNNQQPQNNWNQPPQNNWVRNNPQQNWNQGNQWGGNPNMMPPQGNQWGNNPNMMPPQGNQWGVQPNMMPPQGNQWGNQWGNNPNMMPPQNNMWPQQGNQWGGNVPIGNHHSSAMFGNRNQNRGGDVAGGMFHNPQQGNQWGNANPEASSARRGSSLKPRNKAIMEEFSSEEGYNDYRSEEQKTNDSFKRAWNNAGKGATVAEETHRRRSTLWDSGLGVDNINPVISHSDTSKSGYDVTGTGTILVPASKSGKVKTFVKDQPYSVVYNPKTHVLFHRIYNLDTEYEVVIEVLKTIEEAEAMGYQDHELNVRFKQQVPVREDTVVVPSWDAVERLKEPAPLEEIEKLSDEEKNAFMELEDPLVIPNIFMAYSHQHANVLNELFLNKNEMFNVLRSNELPFEYRYYKIKPFFNVDSKDLTEKVAILGTLNDIDVYAKSLNRLYGQLPADLWVYLNQKATEGVNRALRVGMGFNMDIDNFVSDWETLQEYFVTKYGSEQGSVYISTIKERCKDDIINGGLKVIVGSELDEYLKTLDESLDKEVLKEHGVVLGELYNVTVVPWTTNELNIDISRTAGSVKESSTPELYNAVKSIMDRVSKSVHKTQRVMIKTADQTVVEISKGALGPNHYMLSDIKLCD